MKTINYFILCEDFPQHYFAKKTLSFIFKDYSLNEVLPENIGLKGFKKSFTKNEIQKKSILLIKNVLRNFSNINLILIGLDSDNDKQEKIDTYYKDIPAKISLLTEILNPNTVSIVFVPIKAIEHWILYLKLKKESNYNKADSLENRKTGDIKKEFDTDYRRGRESDNIYKELIDMYYSVGNVKWLQQKSRSFNRFIIDLNKSGL